MDNINSQDVYTGTANLGRTATDISAVFTTIFTIPMIIIGLYLIFKKIKRNSTVLGKISSSTWSPCIPIYSQSCTSSLNNGITTYSCNNTTSFSCNFIVDYQLPDGLNYKQQSKNFNTSGGEQYLPGESIILYYDPSDPTNIELSQDNYAIIGWILIIIAVIMLISTWTWVYFTHKSKMAAAYAGAVTGSKMAGNVIRQF